VYPYYHRKYVFVSLGGYWPDDYSYMRYYWYGYHPYVWYGYYPVATEVAGETNNYYTYNYYNDDGSVTTYQSTEPPAANQSGYADHNTFADVRAKLAQKKPEPAAQTQADTRFEEGVKSFESGEYGTAADKFAKAMELSPEDIILPFAYAQALFANEQYSRAADVLRAAIKKVPPEKEGAFYPRGLYANDDALFKQIEKLVDKQEASSDDADLQLLLGYHLLGSGETGYAREPLEQASQDPKNAEAAATLLKLLDKIEKEAGPADKAGTEASTSSETPAQTPAAAQVEPATPSSSTAETLAPGSTPDTQKDSTSQLTVAPAIPAPEQPTVNKEDNNDL
jgi:tetratricopeptide (TPR) repeat protein